MQVIGPNARISRSKPLSDGFWADEHELALGFTSFGLKAKKLMAPRAFERFVSEGFQLTSTLHQGALSDGSASWSYRIEPRLGWGGEWGVDKQYSTAGWLAALPVFEPHYQVLMAHGHRQRRADIIGPSASEWSLGAPDWGALLSNRGGPLHAEARRAALFCDIWPLEGSC